MKLQIPGYTLIRELGEGGMCVVYLARHEAFEEEVAVKVLHEQYSRQDDMRQRFLHEARIMRNLKHEGIVNVRDFLQVDDRVVLVMDYIEGKTLDHVIGQEIGPIPSEKALPLFRQILEAVAYAHSQGVVHRDLKPSNVMVTNDGRAKVTDFGIAKVMGSAGMTRTGTKLGTLYYMSPEQIKGSRDVDQRSDIYSLGMTLYEMLAGRLPFETHGDTSEFEVTQKIVFKVLEPPDTYYPHIPSRLVRAVLKATSKEPGDRYQTCEEFIRDLEGVSAEEPSEKPSVVKTEPKKQQTQERVKELPQSLKDTQAPIGSSTESIRIQPTSVVAGTGGGRAVPRMDRKFVPYVVAAVFFVFVIAVLITNSKGATTQTGGTTTQTGGTTTQTGGTTSQTGGTTSQTGFEYNGLYWQVGPDREMTWDEANAWVDGLGGTWRLPTRDELQGLWDAGITRDNWGPFENSGWRVWSGEVEVRDSSSAWYFLFNGGGEYWRGRSYSDYLRAFAVRSR